MRRLSLVPPALWRAVDVLRRAALLGLATLACAACVLGACKRDFSRLWFDVSAPSPWQKWTLIALVAIAGFALGLGTRLPRLPRLAVRAALAVVGAFASMDALACIRAADLQLLHTVAPISFSLVLATFLLTTALRPPNPSRSPGPSPSPGPIPRPNLAMVMLAPIFAGAWVSLDIAAMAFTDYRRPADAIVVLGAAVWPPGIPSEALAQRMATACELHRQGYAPLIIVSGGQAANVPSEPSVMKKVAMDCGIPEDRIILDEGGADTRSTARDTARILEERGLSSVLVVSHGYHLARSRLALENEGVVAYTVPAVERRTLPAKPYYLARELAAWVVYAIDVERDRRHASS